jgi:phage internal scaffolding protein
MKVRSPMNVERSKGLDNFGETKTQQHFKNAVNINQIMERYRKTGVLPSVRSQALYGDFTTIGSYHEAMNRVYEAQEAFESLPAKVRTKFKNNPQALIDFVSDEKNLAEAIQLGLVEKKEQIVSKETNAGDGSAPDPS